MKRLILILPFAFLGCEKTYQCTITTQGLENPYIYEFKGTNKEMKEFEQSASSIQTINCK